MPLHDLMMKILNEHLEEIRDCLTNEILDEIIQSVLDNIQNYPMISKQQILEDVRQRLRPEK
jgi:hypothetical protein